jgi:uncharacterized MAPEG superfamily protein
MTFTTALISFAFLTMILITIDIMFTYATQGFAFGFSSNRGTPELSALGTRMKRALQNHIESTAYVVPALAAGALSGLQGYGPELAALLIIVGRALFPPLYWTGIPFIRVPAFSLAALSSAYILIIALMA